MGISREFKKVREGIGSGLRDIIELESILTRNKALAPENGGDGELQKCLALEEWLKKNGITDLKRYDAPDSRVSSGIRPNLVATIKGLDDTKCIWVCAHLDVVPAGEKSLWKTDPWTLTEADGKIYGRGVEDNQQGLCSGVLAALAFVRTGIMPKTTIKLLFMADEEVGSRYGVRYLIKEYPDFFSKNDLILIPDGGDSNGETIEIAEKNIAWFKFHTTGRQSHGSRPDLGRNAHLAACDLALRVHDMENFFDEKNPLFDPPYSTFEPTMHMANVDGVNIIPGDDVFCADCRINPGYTLDQVRAELQKRIDAVEKKYEVKIDVAELQAEQSVATKEDAPVVQKLKFALETAHGIKARCVGIGGGTVGAYLRNAGFDCVVWSSMDELAHQPNEYALISNIAKDAETIACMAVME